MSEHVRVNVEPLTEAELQLLAEAFRGMALDGSLTRPVACFYADAALGLRAVLAGRERQWLDVLADPAVPPSWEQAVATLPPKGPDER